MTRPKYVCPACGHPILPTDPLAFLTLTERAIFDVIYRSGQAGIVRRAVLARVWANTPKGGVTESTVTVHIRNMNKKLPWIKMEISSERSNEARYRVRRLPQDLTAREDAACAQS